QRLAEAGAVASVGSTGDSYDNALAEAFNSLFKAELIRNRGPWKGIDELEIATAEYIDWFNHRRLHGEIGMIPPVELEDIYHHHQTVPATADAALASLQQTWGNSRGDRAEHRRGARRDSAERAHREDENCADQGQQAPEQEQRREVPTPVVAEQREGEHQRRY